MSPYIGKRIIIRDGLGDWWDGLLVDVIEEDGKMRYLLFLDNGDTLKIPVDDESGIIEKRNSKKISANVLPFGKTKTF